jgi:type IV secretory pathway VirB2 component (pilin)
MNATTGIGFIAALASLALNASMIAALHIVFGAFSIGAFVEGAASVYFYERGIRNG